MVRATVQHLESPLQDYEAGVEDFLMAHARKLRTSRSPVRSPEGSNNASRDASPEKSIEQLAAELRQEAREALRKGVFPQLEVDNQKVYRTMAERLWGGDGETLVIESIGKNTKEPELHFIPYGEDGDGDGAAGRYMGAKQGLESLFVGGGGGGGGGAAPGKFVSFEVTVAGDLSAFDEAAFRERVKEALGFRGLTDPSTIAVTLVPNADGTYHVHVRVKATGAVQAVSAAVEKLSNSADVAAAALGLPVASVSPPTAIDTAKSGGARGKGARAEPRGVAVGMGGAPPPEWTENDYPDDGTKINCPANDNSGLKAGSKAWYKQSDGTRVICTIVKVYYDDPPPYYAINLDGQERSTVRDKLRPYLEGQSTAPQPPAGQMGGAGRTLTPRATLMHGLYGGLDEGAILSAFQTCDRDGSGALEKDEFLVFLRALNDETTEKDADTLFALCDNDGSELVTLVEFLRAWRGKPDIVQFEQGIDAADEAKDQLASRAQRMSAMRLERDAEREGQRTSDIKARKRRAMEQRKLSGLDSRLEQESMAQQARIEALLAEENSREQERQRRQQEAAKRLAAQREEKYAAESEVRRAREQQEAAERERRNKGALAKMEAEKLARVEREHAQRLAREEAAEAERLRRIAETAEKEKRGQEARQAAALAQAAALREAREREEEAFRSAQASRISAAAAAELEARRAHELRERSRLDVVEEAARQRQAEKVSAALAAEQEARRLKRQAELDAEIAAEADRLRRLAAESKAAEGALAERRARVEEERRRLEQKREAEAAALPASSRGVLTERRSGRRERERRLEGKSGCFGMLSALREAYGNETDACSAEVFEAAMRFIDAKRVRHVKEILKFKMTDDLVAALPNLDDASASRLRGALVKQAEVAFESMTVPRSPTGYDGSPSPKTKRKAIKRMSPLRTPGELEGLPRYNW